MTRAPQRVTFRDVFAIAEFRALWFAELLSIFGDQLARVALSVLVFQETESAALTGLTYALTYAPSVLGGIFLSGLADRWPRREVMVGVDLIRAVLILLVAIPGMSFAVLAVLVAGVSLLNPPFKAAQLALMPDVLTGDRYVVGLALRSMTNQTAQLLGFAGGGLLIAAIDPHLALAFDGLTFIASALFVRFGVRGRPAARAAGKTARRADFFRSIGQGSRLVFADSGLRTLLLITWVSGILPVYEGLAAPYAHAFGGGSVEVGLLLASDPLGSVIGAFVFTRWVQPATRPKLIGPLAVLAAVPMLVAFLRPGLIPSMVVFLVCGALGTAALMQATASLSLAVPDSSRAQTMGLSNTGLTTAMGLSPAIGGVAADTVGAQAAVGIFGVVGILLTAVLAWAWFRAIGSDPERWTPDDTTPTTPA
ncbi:MFS transporter [Kibdelosporangium persicum]|uniref:Transmembrane secretion effector n=1 Tax=Kibdelosporangium persicum TaxID=2698649 RepID=A0ABX2EXY4_9PSEU|nr:MFS transporter [Kibdelosporangium persicum]NRN63864.1 Transmembrane secretion effector [Kibdelosporangium persicum]